MLYTSCGTSYGIPCSSQSVSTRCMSKFKGDIEESFVLGVSRNYCWPNASYHHSNRLEGLNEITKSLSRERLMWQRFEPGTSTEVGVLTPGTSNYTHAVSYTLYPDHVCSRKLVRLQLVSYSNQCSVLLLSRTHLR
jgi:hypothetical protein